jgi:hypothetical protein
MYLIPQPLKKYLYYTHNWKGIPMTFIRKPVFQIGTIVRLNRAVDTPSGKFTAGHILYAYENTSRGWSFIDQDGNVLTETGLLPEDTFKRMGLAQPGYTDELVEKFGTPLATKTKVVLKNTPEEELVKLRLELKTALDLLRVCKVWIAKVDQPELWKAVRDFILAKEAEERGL